MSPNNATPTPNLSAEGSAAPSHNASWSPSWSPPPAQEDQNILNRDVVHRYDEGQDRRLLRVRFNFIPLQRRIRLAELR